MENANLVRDVGDVRETESTDDKELTLKTRSETELKDVLQLFPNLLIARSQTSSRTFCPNILIWMHKRERKSSRFELRN
jgi:hypothetical protein